MKMVSKALAVMLLGTAALAACGPNKEEECASFMKVARPGLAKAKKVNMPTADKTAYEQGNEQYRTFATELEGIQIKDAELKKLVGEYAAHMRGVAELRERGSGDRFAILDELVEREEAGNALTAKINAYCDPFKRK